MTMRRQTPHHPFLPFTIHTAAVQVESTSTSSVPNNTDTQEEEAPHHRPSALPLPPIAFVSTNNDDVPSRCSFEIGFQSDTKYAFVYPQRYSFFWLPRVKTQRIIFVTVIW